MFLRFLHRLLEIFLHVERRFEQPFLRPALDAALRMPIALFVTTIQNSLRSREDIGLAEETPLPGEDEAVQTMIDEMRRHLVRDFPRGGFERAGNTKTHGLVRGELVIHDGLPDKLRKGLFATPATYRCWVRFSGPGPHIEPDINDVGFGSICVKVMGVPGEKLWDDEKHTQDFTSVCTPTFVTPDVKANARLQYWSRRHLPVFYFFDPREPHLLDFIMQGLWNETQTNPLGQTYYSCVPYLMGPGQAMQYSFWPMTKVSKRIEGLPFWVADNYLRDNMVRTLDAMDVEFELRVQLQTDPFLMPIENNAVHVADQAIAARPRRDAAHPEADVRLSGSVRLHALPALQSLALPARPPSARQPEPGAQAHVRRDGGLPAEDERRAAYRADRRRGFRGGAGGRQGRRARGIVRSTGSRSTSALGARA